MPHRGQWKVLSKRKQARSAPPVLQSPSKIKVKRKQWTNEQMEEALEAVESGEISINIDY